MALFANFVEYKAMKFCCIWWTAVGFGGFEIFSICFSVHVSKIWSFTFSSRYETAVVYFISLYFRRADTEIYTRSGWKAKRRKDRNWFCIMSSGVVELLLCSIYLEGTRTRHPYLDSNRRKRNSLQTNQMSL